MSCVKIVLFSLPKNNQVHKMTDFVLRRLRSACTLTKTDQNLFCVLGRLTDKSAYFISQPKFLFCLFSGAFVFPFVLMLFLLGLPLMFMELSFGQFAGLGPAVVFERFCPLFHGKLS